MLFVLDRTDRHLYGFLYFVLWHLTFLISAKPRTIIFDKRKSCHLTFVLGTSTHCPVRRLIIIISYAFKRVLHTFTRKSLQNYYFFLTWPNFFARKIKKTRYLVDFVRLCTILPFKNTHINESLTFTTTTTRLVPANTRPYLDHIYTIPRPYKVRCRTLRGMSPYSQTTVWALFLYSYTILYIYI